MNKKLTSDFAWGIIGNIVASFLIAVVNILVGRFIPKAPREVLDIASLILPLLLILLLLYRDKLRQVRFKPRLWISRTRNLLSQSPQISRFYQNILYEFRKLFLQIYEISRNTKNLVRVFEKAKKPSIIIVTFITVFFIVSFGVSIRWLFEQRTSTTVLPVYNSYRQIYDLLAH